MRAAEWCGGQVPVEGLNDARTKLADFINSLLDRILKDRLGPNRLRQHSTTFELLKNTTRGFKGPDHFTQRVLAELQDGARQP